MKIVLDLQGAQSHSRHRGIGRYSLAIAKAVAQQAGEHEVWLALNGRHVEAANSIIEQFDGLLPRSQIAICELPANIAGCLPHNQPRARLAEIAQARFFASLQADYIWHSSLFEGWGDDSTATLGTGGDDTRHAATLYDLIPALHPDRYMHDLRYQRWYYRRLGLIKRCHVLLAISESSRQEAIDHLHIDADRIAVVYGAADSQFRPDMPGEAEWYNWQRRWRLRPGFVLYAGGFDKHKNVDALIAAYADLPVALRDKHQLVLAGRCEERVEKSLRIMARTHGLQEGSVVFTGDIADRELIWMYSSCALFVAPSLHEGFGLPPLEAMACGAPVIGSNATSVPEVIGRRDALFDPRSESSIATKMQQVLNDPAMRAQLREHGLSQSRRFSWHESARVALAAIEADVAASHGVSQRSARPRLIFVSPLPPARSGIADYSTRLLREMSAYYDIEVVVDQAEVSDPWVQGNYPIHTSSWLESQSFVDARIVYHVGNSPHHARMFNLLAQHPGVVVLHDSFLGAAKNWMAQTTHEPQFYLSQLYQSHGFTALKHDQTFGRPSTLRHYPISLDVIEHALGVIVHSKHAKDLAEQYYGEAAASTYMVVPFAKATFRADRSAARRLLGIGMDDFVVCSFGMVAPTKLSDRLLAAWLASSLVGDRRCQLVFVGENHGGQYGSDLLAVIRQSLGADRICITGFVSDDNYRDYLAAADVAVQLRTDSRGESSAAVFDALARGLPTIVNAHGSAAELPDDVVIKLVDRFSDSDLIRALEWLRENASARLAIGDAAVQWIQAVHHPSRAVVAYRDAMEHFYKHASASQAHRLAVRMQQASSKPVINELGAVRDYRRLDRPRIYVDVTATAKTTLHTGIERVVRGVLTQLLIHDIDKWRIEPIRLEQGRFLHANSYGLHLIERDDVTLDEEEVYPQSGDILLGLDWSADSIPANRPLLDAWRMHGVRMYFVIYDLLPVLRPEWFPEGISAMHAAWLDCIGHYADGLLCISQTVANELRHWYECHAPDRREPLPLGYFYPGNDLDATRPSRGTPDDAESQLAALRASPTFLMVGTVEPRKGHGLVLDAFEQFWEQGAQASLVVVGKPGWMSQAVVERLRHASKSSGRVIWLEHVSDEYLEQIYGVATALIAASEGEGFGLPLVEAIRRGLPVIARDIPVFREVSSTFARYFDGGNVESLIAALRSTIVGPINETVLIANAMPSWHATTLQLVEMLSAPEHPQWLLPWREQSGDKINT